MCNDSGFIFLSFKSFPCLDCGLSLDGNSGGYVQNPSAPQQHPPSPSSKPPTLPPAAPNLPLLSVLSPHGQPDQAIPGALGAPISLGPNPKSCPQPATLAPGSRARLLLPSPLSCPSGPLTPVLTPPCVVLFTHLPQHRGWFAVSCPGRPGTGTVRARAAGWGRGQGDVAECLRATRRGADTRPGRVTVRGPGREVGAQAQLVDTGREARATRTPKVDLLCHSKVLLIGCRA